MDSKVKRIDEHLYNPARTEKQYLVTSAKRLHAKTSVRYRLSKLNQPGGMFSLSGNTFNPHLKTWAILFLAITGIFTGGILAQGSLFHASQSACIDYGAKPPGAPCEDPSQIIWQDIGGNGLAGLKTTGTVISTGACYIAGLSCVQMTANTANTTIALTTTSIGDLNSASKYLLSLHIEIAPGGSNRVSGSDFVGTWGYYLTTNATVPTHNIGSSAAYDPMDDPSVALVVYTFCTNNVHPCSNSANGGMNWNEQGTLQRKIQESIHSEFDGVCGGPGSLFLCQAQNPTIASHLVEDSAFYLNYTGVVGPGSCTVNGNPGVFGPAPGCSWMLNQPDNGNAQTQYWTSTQNLPFFELTNQYHIGFFQMPDANTPVTQFFFNAGAGNMDVFTFVPSTTGPTIDTGGFFGPVIRALIGIGVFILQSILTFANYLWTILQPVFTTIVTLLISILASIAAIIITVIKAVLNAIGTGLGISSLGDNLFTFLGDIAAFFTTFFANSLAQLSSFITFLTNGYSTISASFSTYWTDVANWTSGIKDLLAGLWVIGGQLFTISFAFMFSGWLLFGAKKFSDSVGEGMEWFNLTRQFVMIGVALALFLFTMILHYVIIPVFHAVTATGEAKKTAEPDVVIGGTGVG